MTFRAIAAASSVAALCASTVCAQTTPKLTGPYLGESPPGDSAVLFAVGFLSTDLHSGPVFSRDGQEVFWSPLGGSTGHILTSRLTDAGWTAPREVRFPTGPPNSFEPCLSPDGTRLFFISQGSAAEDYKETIWVATREGDGWGTPQLASPFISALDVYWQMSVAENGNLYFHARPMRGGDIYVSALVGGTYQEPVALGSTVNSDLGEGSPFIAPDESYIIFDSRREGGYGTSDLYISFRAADGSWGPAINMGDKINTTNAENYPSVSPDGKFLFFDRRIGKRIKGEKNVDIYWVDAQIIETLRPK